MPRRRDQELLRAVGQRVAQARKDRGFTQEQLSETLGIEPVTLSRLETGHRALSLSTLARVADVLGIALGDLLDVSRALPKPVFGPEEAEILRLFQRLPEDRRDILLRLAHALSST